MEEDGKMALSFFFSLSLFFIEKGESFKFEEVVKFCRRLETTGVH